MGDGDDTGCAAKAVALAVLRHEACKASVHELSLRRRVLCLVAGTGGSRPKAGPCLSGLSAQQLVTVPARVRRTAQAALHDEAKHGANGRRHEWHRQTRPPLKSRLQRSIDALAERAEEVLRTQMLSGFMRTARYV